MPGRATPGNFAGAESGMEAGAGRGAATAAPAAAGPVAGCARCSEGDGQVGGAFAETALLPDKSASRLLGSDSESDWEHDASWTDGACGTGRDGGAPGRLGFMEKLTGRSETEAAGGGEEGTMLI